MTFASPQNMQLGILQNQVLGKYMSNLAEHFFHCICILTLSFSIMKGKLCQLLQQNRQQLGAGKDVLFGQYREEKSYYIYNYFLNKVRSRILWF